MKLEGFFADVVYQQPGADQVGGHGEAFGGDGKVDEGRCARPHFDGAAKQSRYTGSFGNLDEAASAEDATGLGRYVPV